MKSDLGVVSRAVVKRKRKRAITDCEIVELYKRGWTINDIIAHYSTNIQYVRQVLRSNGIETHKFRSVPLLWKKCILALIASGFSTGFIAHTADVSTHLIRHVLRDEQISIPELRQITEDNPTSDQNIEVSDVQYNQFLNLYRAGKLGFMKCLEEVGLDDHHCVDLVGRLKESDINSHEQNLILSLESFRATGLSPSTIAKQFGISAAYAKKIMYNSHANK